jgi:hypothetical protein
MTGTALTTCDTIGEIYRANATAHPDKVALVGTSRTLTYGALDEREPPERRADDGRAATRRSGRGGVAQSTRAVRDLRHREVRLVPSRSTGGSPDELRAVLRDCRPAATIVSPTSKGRSALEPTRRLRCS